MAQRPHLSYSDITWERVFQSVEMSESETAVSKSIIKGDDPPIMLRSFMSGTHHTVMKMLCKTDELYEKVSSAVAKLVNTKRSRFEKEFKSPSDYAKNPEPIDFIHDHRDSHALHVSLQMEPFAKFIDLMSETDQLPSKYYNVATLLMQDMSSSFKTELDRMNSFSVITEELFPFQAAVVGCGTTDGTTRVDVEGETYSVANWEFKNEFSSVTCTSCPVRQNNGYFVHLQAGRCDRSPMLLLSIVGCHYFQVFGAVWNGAKLCTDPLCSPVSLLFVPRDPTNGVSKVARLLAAIDSTIDELKRYLQKDDTHNKGPYWCPGLCNIKETSNSLWLFEAEYQGKKVYIKFVRSHYGKDVHTLLASQKPQLAPKLFLCEQLPGGWVAVVMEKLEGSKIPSTMAVNKQVKESLEKAVKLMHSKNFVHGDLRPQNILVIDNQRVCILDLDWAGKEHDARYPPELNMDNDWHPTAEPGGFIRKEHDTYQIENISIK